jgi:Uncharacterized conserved protein (DUF2285)
LAPKLEPDIAAIAPWSEGLTDYDLEHLAVYLRLLDAEAAGADWREAAGMVLRLGPDEAEASARRCWETHLARARWMTDTGYRLLLEHKDD